MYEIYTYGGGDFLRLVFNGIASILGDANYLGLLRTIVIIGVVTVMMSAVFKGTLVNLRSFLTIFFVLLALFLPKVTITINDRVIPANSASVGNVPFGVAISIAFFSRASDYMTRGFETVYSMPSDLKYSGNGLLFANHLVEQATHFELTDPRVANNFIDFWKSCVFYDLALQLYSWDDLLGAKDVMGFLKNKTARSRYFTYTNKLNQNSLLQCRSGISNQMAADLKDAVTAVSRNQAIRLYPDQTDINAAVSKFASAMPIAMRYLTGLSQQASETIQQSVLSNSFERGFINFAAEVDAEAAIKDYALARAEAERSATFSIMGNMAKRMLPIIQHLLEAFIYAICPIVIAMAMLPISGKVLLGYAKALLWINCWPPLYAVLHFGMSYYSQNAAKAAVTVADSTSNIQAHSMYTNTALGAELSHYAALAGYLTVSIPLIAWMLVSGSGAIMASLGNRLLAGYESPVSSSVNEAAGGNINLGNFNMDNANYAQQRLAPNIQSGGSIFSDAAGNTIRITPDGQLLFDVSQSTAPIDLNFGQYFRATSEGRYSEAASKLEETSNNMSTTNSALYNRISEYSNDFSSGNHLTDSTTHGTATKYEEAGKELNKLVTSFGESIGITDIDQVKGLISAGINGEIKGESKGGVSGGVDVGGGVRGEVNKSYLNEDTLKKVKEFTASSEFTQALTKLANVLNEMSYKEHSSISDTSKTAYQAAYTDQQAASYAFQSAIKEEIIASQILARVESGQLDINQQRLDSFKSFLVEEGLSSDRVMQLISQANHGDSRDQQDLSNYLSRYSQAEIEKIHKGLFSGNDLGNVDVPGEMNNIKESSANLALSDQNKSEIIGVHQDDVIKVRQSDRINTVEMQQGHQDAENQMGIQKTELANTPVIDSNNLNQQAGGIQSKVEEAVKTEPTERAAEDVQKMAEEVVNTVNDAVNELKDKAGDFKDKLTKI